MIYFTTTPSFEALTNLYTLFYTPKYSINLGTCYSQVSKLLDNCSKKLSALVTILVLPSLTKCGKKSFESFQSDLLWNDPQLEELLLFLSHIAIQQSLKFYNLHPLLKNQVLQS